MKILISFLFLFTILCSTDLSAQNVKNSFAPADSSNDNAFTIDGTIVKFGRNVTRDVTFKVIVTASLAEINAGKVLIPGIAGHQILVTDFALKVVGNFTTNTGIGIIGSSGGGLHVGYVPQALLVNNAFIKPEAATITRGYYFQNYLPAGEGVSIRNVGAGAAAGTMIGFTIEYQVI